MAAVDPYTSRLEAGMRLLTDRLAFMDAQARQLVAENEALRNELDLTIRRVEVEVEARARAQEILAAAARREPAAGPESWPPPGEEPVAAHPPGPEEGEQLQARADALQAEIEALLELRETVVTSIRETLIGLAERLAAAERDHAAAAG